MFHTLKSEAFQSKFHPSEIYYEKDMRARSAIEKHRRRHDIFRRNIRDAEKSGQFLGKKANEKHLIKAFSFRWRAGRPNRFEKSSWQSLL